MKFHEFAKNKLGQVENKMVTAVQTEKNIEALQNQLGALVEDTKRDFNRQVDSLQEQIKSLKPSTNDPDFERKNEQYARFLASSIEGMRSMRTILRQVFDRLCGIVSSIVDWMRRKVRAIVVSIRDMFRDLIRLFS